MSAGTADNTAGAFSPFTLEVSRDDGDQEPTALTVDTPPGFLASLRGVAYCPEATISGLLAGAYNGRQEQAAPLCPAVEPPRFDQGRRRARDAARSTSAATSTWRGPYKGAPLSLLVVIPAVSGPV